MSFNISAWAIRKPIPSLVLFVVLTIIGIASFVALPITNMPNIDLPLVSVTVNQTGAAPSELKTQVTKRVETSVAGLAGVKHNGPRPPNSVYLLPRLPKPCALQLLAIQAKILPSTQPANAKLISA